VNRAVAEDIAKPRNLVVRHFLGQYVHVHGKISLWQRLGQSSQ
jgi:hypothetical protein